MDWRNPFRVLKPYPLAATHPFRTPLPTTRRRRVAFSRAAPIVALVLMLHVFSGCYHYRVTAPDPLPASPAKSEQITVHSVFWGLFPKSQPHVFAKNCRMSNALDEVKMTTNFGYAFVTILSLGLWSPMDVEWRCSKVPSPEIEEEL